MTSQELHIVQADLANPLHRRAIESLTNAYACDDMGGGEELPPEVLARLVAGLQAHPTTVALLAFVGEQPVGLATCFLGFSTFLARPLLNVHDLAVLPDCRGKGVGAALLRAVERTAAERGCAKVTLEVGDRNDRARALYEREGFRHASAGSTAGAALFYSKPVQAPGGSAGRSAS